MSEFSILLWKEFRSQFYMVVCLAAALLMPIATAYYLVLSNASKEATFQDCFSTSLVYGSYLGLGLSQIVLLCLGGMLIGNERILRTFEFLFTQPVSRTKVALSKLCFGLLLFVMIWIIGGLIIYCGFSIAGDHPVEYLGWLLMSEIGSVGLLLFSSSWLVSCRLDHPVLSITIGLLISLLTIGAVAEFFQYVDWYRTGLINYQWCRTASVWTYLLIVSPAMMAIGTHQFVRRKTP